MTFHDWSDVFEPNLLHGCRNDVLRNIEPMKILKFVLKYFDRRENGKNTWVIEADQINERVWASKPREIKKNCLDVRKLHSDVTFAYVI